LPFCFTIIYHGNAIKKRKKCNKGYGSRKQKYSIIGKLADKNFSHSKEPGKKGIPESGTKECSLTSSI
jgi:hypothetical protein